MNLEGQYRHSVLKYSFKKPGAYQLVKLLTLAQDTISQLMISSSEVGSVLTAESLEPASDSVSPFLSALPSLSPSLPPTLSK